MRMWSRPIWGRVRPVGGDAVGKRNIGVPSFQSHDLARHMPRWTVNVQTPAGGRSDRKEQSCDPLLSVRAVPRVCQGRQNASLPKLRYARSDARCRSNTPTDIAFPVNVLRAGVKCPPQGAQCNLRLRTDQRWRIQPQHPTNIPPNTMNRDQCRSSWSDFSCYLIGTRLHATQRIYLLAQWAIGLP